ncbi:uncharacterized protein LOC135492906 isoform X2 [Lineus longissimus]|uniref:uncharacterized protein LOC135492906 isoform X2 n=1 Tax=Lineus longissimus TaxID=88925 RepID=UPI00315DBEBF
MYVMYYIAKYLRYTTFLVFLAEKALLARDQTKHVTSFLACAIMCMHIEDCQTFNPMWDGDAYMCQISQTRVSCMKQERGYFDCENSKIYKKKERKSMTFRSEDAYFNPPIRLLKIGSDDFDSLWQPGLIFVGLHTDDDPRYTMIVYSYDEEHNKFHIVSNGKFYKKISALYWFYASCIMIEAVHDRGRAVEYWLYNIWTKELTKTFSYTDPCSSYNGYVVNAMKFGDGVCNICCAHKSPRTRARKNYIVDVYVKNPGGTVNIILVNVTVIPLTSVCGGTFIRGGDMIAVVQTSRGKSNCFSAVLYRRIDKYNKPIYYPLQEPRWISLVIALWNRYDDFITFLYFAGSRRAIREGRRGFLRGVRLVCSQGKGTKVFEPLNIKLVRGSIQREHKNDFSITRDGRILLIIKDQAYSKTYRPKSVRVYKRL